MCFSRVVFVIFFSRRLPSPAGASVRRTELSRARDELSGLDAQLDALAAEAAALTRQFETPKALLRALDEQQRVAAIDRLLSHAHHLDDDLTDTENKQKMIGLLIEETERQLGYLAPTPAVAPTVAALVEPTTLPGPRQFPSATSAVC